MTSTTRGRPFAKGQSGNPGGRPKSVEAIRELAREHTTAAIEGLVAIARNSKTPAAARVAAWNAILDRGHGKPSQALTGEGGEAPTEIVFRWADSSDEVGKPPS